MAVVRVLKATAAGIVGGVITGVIATLVFLQLQLRWQVQRATGGGQDTASVSFAWASVSLGWTLLAAIIGFLLVFFSVLRRS